MSCPVDACVGGTLTMRGNVIAHGVNSDQSFNAIRYGEEGPVRYNYDDSTGYTDTVDIQDNLFIEFVQNKYANPFIAIELDAKMAAAGKPDASSAP